MEKESFIIRMEAIMKANGRITKWMGLENYTMKEESLLMRAIGVKISLMD